MKKALRVEMALFRTNRCHTPLPDHSSLTRIRGRYGIEIFRRFFEEITSQCQQAGLVWGKELYLDSTQMQANASVNSLKARFAIEAHLSSLFSEEGEAQQQSTAFDEVEDGEVPDDLANREDGHHTNQVQGVSEPRPPLELPADVSPSLKEELAQQHRQRHNWIERLGRPEHPQDGEPQRISDFRLSTTDPDATLMPTEHLGYKTHYVVNAAGRMSHSLL